MYFVVSLYLLVLTTCGITLSGYVNRCNEGLRARWNLGESGTIWEMLCDYGSNICVHLGAVKLGFPWRGSV